MADMAQWGTHIFGCSPSKLTPFRDFKATMAVKSDTQTDANGTDKTASKGKEPETVSFSVNYLLGAGVNPWKEVDGWRNDLGNSNNLYIGGKRYGNERFTLQSVDVSNLLANNTGRVLGVNVALSFKEYSTTISKGATSGTSGSSGGGNKTLSSDSGKKAAYNKAMNTTIKKDAKKEKTEKLLSRRYEHPL